jgi:hypothetical protein
MIPYLCEFFFEHFWHWLGLFFLINAAVGTFRELSK